MNGIEKITARIQEDAQTEIAAMTAAAREKAAAVRAQYEAQAAAETEKALESGRKAAQQRYERLEGAADMEAKKLILGTKQQSIEAAFAKAKETILTLPEEEYAALLAKLAVASAKSGKEEILLNAADREKVGAKVVEKANALLEGKGELTLAEDVRDIEGGLILRDGKVEINCAFETQLRILRETMAAEVAKVLFP
ncbi:MAG: V-type ATP synthase subunit E [Oscillospiraceae bacterium]|nr:V-type ATP synthase subunit E [Oscillospiraceae bacterium]